MQARVGGWWLIRWTASLGQGATRQALEMQGSAGAMLHTLAAIAVIVQQARFSHLSIMVRVLADDGWGKYLACSILHSQLFRDDVLFFFRIEVPVS